MFLLIQGRCPLQEMRCKISIHLMFLLILACCSPTSPTSYFNTSHVSINQRNASSKSVMSCDFNTSHVSINRRGCSGFGAPQDDFNTSHVSINRADENACRMHSIISIHLMFLLISLRSVHESCCYL